MVQKRVNKYVNQNPRASFEEIEKNCFPGIDYNISCFAISPRHFEAVITKTLQVLVEGYYGGVFKPWVHYLPLKKDYSNFNEIIGFLKDSEKCQNIIDNAFNDIVLSGKYTYKTFVEAVLKEYKMKLKIIVDKPNNFERFYHSILTLREKMISLLVYFGWYKINFYHVAVMTYKKTIQSFIPSGTRDKIERKFKR